MPTEITLHILLVVFALGAAFCLGWQAMVAVWSWVTSQGVGAAVLGVLLLVIVAVLLAIGV